MNKTFKYSLLVLRNPEDEACYEITFEDRNVIRRNEERRFIVENKIHNFQIMSVLRIDPIAEPNSRFDYQLFGVGK